MLVAACGTDPTLSSSDTDPGSGIDEPGDPTPTVSTIDVTITPDTDATSRLTAYWIHDASGAVVRVITPTGATESLTVPEHGMITEERWSRLNQGVVRRTVTRLEANDQISFAREPLQQSVGHVAVTLENAPAGAIQIVSHCGGAITTTASAQLVLYANPCFDPSIFAINFDGTPRYAEAGDNLVDGAAVTLEGPWDPIPAHPTTLHGLPTSGTATFASAFYLGRMPLHDFAAQPVTPSGPVADSFHMDGFGIDAIDTLIAEQDGGRRIWSERSRGETDRTIELLAPVEPTAVAGSLTWGTANPGVALVEMTTQLGHWIVVAPADAGDMKLPATPEGTPSSARSITVVDAERVDYALVRHNPRFLDNVDRAVGFDRVRTSSAPVR